MTNDDSGKWYRMLGKIAIVGLLIAAPMTVNIDTSTVGVAAATVGEYEDTFEDGDIDGWDGQYDEVSTNSYSGDYSLRLNGDIHESTWTAGPSLNNYDENYIRGTFLNADSDDQNGIEIQVDTDNFVYLQFDLDGSGTYFKLGHKANSNTNTQEFGSWSANEWYRFNLSIENSQTRVKVWQAGNQEPDSWDATVSKPSDWSGSANINVQSTGQEGIYLDDIGVNTDPNAQTVSGTATDSNGNALNEATVSTGTGESTTTSSDGSWTLKLADGDYTVTTSKDGYKDESQSVSVSGSDVTGVNFSLPDSVTGTVYDSEGKALEDVNISTGTGASTTTSSDGSWSLPLSDGSYNITAGHDDYKNKTKSVDVTGTSTSGVDFMIESSAIYEMEFGIDDQTNASVFSGEEPRLIISRPDGSATATDFNHNEKAFADLENRKYYDLTVTSEYPAVWDFNGFLAVKDIKSGTLVMDSDLWDESTTLGTPTSSNENLDEELDVRFEELEESLSGKNGTVVTVESPEPVESIEYTIEDESGSAVYNESREFDEPTRLWQSRVSDNVSNNASELDAPTVDYSGTYDNETSFNGSADLSGNLEGGSVFGPTGSSSSRNSGSTVVGLGLLAGGGYLAVRTFSSGSVGSTVTSAVDRLRGS